MISIAMYKLCTGFDRSVTFGLTVVEYGRVGVEERKDVDDLIGAMVVEGGLEDTSV
jgi:hypothetical protein